MEIENKYASKGVAGAGLGLGIAGTALGLLQGNGLNGILGGWGNGNCIPSESMPVTRYDAGKDARIAELETEVKLRDANIYTDSKLNDLRNYVDVKFATVNDKLCAQAVHNATNDAVLGCMQSQIAQLMGLTKLVVPNTSVCPGWGNVTITPAAAPAAGA
jgi:hypothetical protein